MGFTVVDDVPFGTYVVKVKVGPDKGKYLADDEGRYLCIMAKRNDPKRVRALLEVVKTFGYSYRDVSLEFRSGARMISDEQYEEQRGRLALGLQPDPDDVGSLLDDYRDGRIG